MTRVIHIDHSGQPYRRTETIAFSPHHSASTEISFHPKPFINQPVNYFVKGEIIFFFCFYCFIPKYIVSLQAYLKHITDSIQI